MKLADYLKSHSLTHEAFALKLQVRPNSVTRYIAGARIPRPVLMRKIAKETKGKVTAADFYD